MTAVTVTRGDSPLILSFPHVGTDLPEDESPRLNDEGRLLRDTDWHVDQLYDGLVPGVTTIRARFHRYAIDVNRPPTGDSLYPGQATTGLIPETDFDGRAIRKPGAEVDAAETARRVSDIHHPYHQAIRDEMERVRAIHGAAILYDCHSIRSRVPRLFDGVLPDFNIGTNDGQSCAPGIERTAEDICALAAGFTCVLNGRFKGGWTTRHHGRPEEGFHAIQMELAQSTHLVSEDPPFAFDPVGSERIRPHLRSLLSALAELVCDGPLNARQSSA